MKKKPPHLTPDQSEQWDRAFGNLKKKKASSPANQLNADVIDYIKSQGGFAFRVNNMGVYRAKAKKGLSAHLSFTEGVVVEEKFTGMWTKGGTIKGIADIHGIHPRSGRSVWVETKTPNDKLSPEQKEFRDNVVKSGGVWLCCRDVEVFKTEWSKI